MCTIKGAYNTALNCAPCLTSACLLRHKHTPSLLTFSGFCRLFKSTISTDAVQNRDKDLPAYCPQQSSLNTISYAEWFCDEWTDPIADCSGFSNLIVKGFVVFSDFQASLLSEEPVMLHIWLQLEFHVAAGGKSYQAVIKQILCPSSDAQNVLPQISTLITLG